MKKKDSKINVLLLLSSVSGGGAQRLVLNHMYHFNKRKFNVYVVSLRSGNMSSLFNELDEKYYCLNQKSRFSFKNFIKLLHFIKEKKIQIIHTHLLEADTYGFLLKLFLPRIKLISTRHGENKFRKKIYWGLFNYFISLNFYRIICVSQSLCKFIRRYEFIPKKKIILIYNGIDTDFFKKEDHNNLRKRLLGQKNKDLILIGIVGRLKKLKGHEVLFKALKILKQKGFHNIKVLVLGDGYHFQNLKQLRKELNLEKEILFLGFQKNIKDYYNIFDILCLPSYYEGLPLVPIEAMSCECLVLCSDIPNNTEVIQHGIDGIIFKTGDHHDLALKIEEVLINKYNNDKLKENARKKVLKKFNFKKTIKNIENLYFKALKIQE
ncbi:MAG: glycosyltransferase family 4 protein [Promethearchaeia archaeon]